MAQKIQTLFIDDLDGSEAEGAVRFALDGVHYEIDLNAVHARELRDALARYTEAGRKAAGTSRRPAKNPGKATASKPNTPEVRDWARANGLDIKNRGRIPADMMAKFRAANTK